MQTTFKTAIVDVFYIARNNRTQQNAIYRVLRAKLGLSNRTAKLCAHEAMESHRNNLEYGYCQPFEFQNDNSAIRFMSVV